jgi:hypothetical protein
MHGVGGQVLIDTTPNSRQQPPARQKGNVRRHGPRGSF